MNVRHALQFRESNAVKERGEEPCDVGWLSSSSKAAPKTFVEEETEDSERKS